MNTTNNLLDSWLKLSVVLRNERYVDSLTFNEMLVLRMLSNGNYIQIKDICEKTKMLKSAINRILNDLEKKDFITRNRFTENRKIVYVKITNKGQEHYLKEHKSVLKIVEDIKEHLGEEESLKVIEAFKKVSATLEKITRGEESGN